MFNFTKRLFQPYWCLVHLTQIVPQSLIEFVVLYVLLNNPQQVMPKRLDQHRTKYVDLVGVHGSGVVFDTKRLGF